MVTLVNKFTIKEGVSEEKFVQVFKESTIFMKAQPGFLGFTFHKSLKDPGVYVNIAHWEKPENHIAVQRSEAFQVHVQGLAEVAIPEPGLYLPLFTHEDI